MRFEMLVGMQIEILNSGKILVNCALKWNQNLDLNLYREIQKNSNSTKISIRICTARHREIWVSQFWSVDYNLPTIHDFNLHSDEHFESHLLGNGLYQFYSLESLVSKHISWRVFSWNNLRHTCPWLMSQIWTTLHICMSHVPHMNNSCLTSAMAFCEMPDNLEISSTHLKVTKILSWYRKDFGNSDLEVATKVLGWLRGCVIYIYIYIHIDK